MNVFSLHGNVICIKRAAFLRLAKKTSKANSTNRENFSLKDDFGRIEVENDWSIPLSLAVHTVCTKKHLNLFIIKTVRVVSSIIIRINNLGISPNSTFYVSESTGFLTCWKESLQKSVGTRNPVIRVALSEFIGTFFLCLVGNGAVHESALTGGSALQTCFAFGMSVTFGVYISCSGSGQDTRQ